MTISRMVTIPAFLLASLSTLGCGDHDAGGGSAGEPPLAVNAGAPQVVRSCDLVELRGRAEGGPARFVWESLDDILLTLEATDLAHARFRAPAVATETTFRFQLRATGNDGHTTASTTSVRVEPVVPEVDLAPGMARDCAPFRYGVASGDPLPDGALLWTRVDPSPSGGELTVRWEVAEDSSFRHVAAAGSTKASPASDYTVRVDAGGLRPAHTYYYRFQDENGVWSSTGRTRTAPQGPVEEAILAGMSCSSIYSGYFNAYRRLSERLDLDLVLHVGDYIYDFVDEDEQVRVPSPFPIPPQSMEEWRARHAYYLADPDLRRARAMHPWMLLWDNHDVEATAAPTYDGSVQAFLEWNPIRVPDPTSPERIYRTLHYGDLLDIVFLDALLFRGMDTVPGTTQTSILGNRQFDWLAGQLRASRSVWRVLANQRVMGTIRINPTYAQFVGGERREVFDPGAWDGFPADRTRLLRFLVEENIPDNLVLSGDSHISVALDLVDDPSDPGFPSAGVEILPTSISRGNFDETMRGLGLAAGMQRSLLQAIAADTSRRNPHHRYVELTKHGYGVFSVTQERIEATFWYSEILAPSEMEEAGPSLVVRRGANRWQRNG